MIGYICDLLLKVCFSIIGFFLVVFTWKHFKAIRRLNYYKKQGATIACGADRYFLGNLGDLANREKLVKNNEQVKIHEAWILDLVAKANG